MRIRFGDAKPNNHQFLESKLLWNEKTMAVTTFCKTKLDDLIRKKGGLQTSIVVIIVVSVIVLIIRLVLLFLRLLIDPSAEIWIDNLIDFVGFPIIVLSYHIFLLIGVLIDSQNTQHEILQFSTTMTESESNDPSGHNIDRLKVDVSIKSLIILTAFYLLNLTLFVIGQGLHYGANFLNLLARDQNIMNTHPDYYQILWIVDEIIGHWFLYSGFWGLFFLLGYLNLKFPSVQRTSKKEWRLLISFAFIGGIIWVFLAVEGAYAWWGIAVALINILYFGNALNQRGQFQKGTKNLAQYKVVAFLILFFISSIVGLITYYVTLGSFIQPSEFLRNFFSLS